MISINSLKQLRLPFSIFLMPVFFFALALTPNHNEARILWVFLAVHVFLYPSCSGFKSFFSKNESGSTTVAQEESTGLLWIALVLLLIAIGIGVRINWSFAGMIAVYGMVSLAVAYPSLAISKNHWLNWFFTGLFQGYFAFAMMYAGLSALSWEMLFKSHVLIPGVLVSLLFWAAYPFTQMHLQKGIKNIAYPTLEKILGPKGIFLFSAIIFLLAGFSFTWYFNEKNQTEAIYTFLACILPMILYFLIWFSFVRFNSKKHTNYKWATGMTICITLGLNAFFIYYFLKNTQILQALGY